MKRTSRGAGGFTLIELMVVIVIMVILMAIVVSAVSRLQVGHERSETTARLHALSVALGAYREDWGDVPPWNPTQTAGVPNGAGLYTLVWLGYLQSYRYLHDCGSTWPTLPWMLDGNGNRVNGIIPDDPNNGTNGLLAAYNAATGGGQNPPLLPSQYYAAYVALASPAAHAYTGGTLPNFINYDEDLNENFCSWMMQDPFTLEWKYQPVRATGTFAVADPTQPTYYRRQLSHYGTDENDPRYLPANDTVVTWSTMFRGRITQPAPQYNLASWGIDIVLYADGHVATIAAPQNSGGTWGPPRASALPVTP
jgi:prepilin-type N-terminal cleavage/methylation domain-containing protein